MTVEINCLNDRHLMESKSGIDVVNLCSIHMDGIEFGNLACINCMIVSSWCHPFVHIIKGYLCYFFTMTYYDQNDLIWL
jgi:hypothetical protein